MNVYLNGSMRDTYGCTSNGSMRDTYGCTSKWIYEGHI